MLQRMFDFGRRRAPAEPQSEPVQLEAVRLQSGDRKMTGRVHQFNVRVRAGVKERVQALAHARGRGTTDGEMLEVMLEAYEAGTLAGSARPGGEDRDAGRTAEIRLWAHEDVAVVIERIAKARCMSPSALLEKWVAGEIGELRAEGITVGARVT